MFDQTMLDALDSACSACPDRVWLRDRQGDVFSEWTWRQARREIRAAAAWLEQRYDASSSNIVLLSRNCAHWFMADLAIVASGNVSVPMFTTLPASTAKYIVEFTDAKAVILGEADNWSAVKQILPSDVDVIALPGVAIDEPHIAWTEIVSEAGEARPAFEPKPDDLITIVFTSGTTGVPKGVMQSHASMLVPMQRGKGAFGLREQPRLLSYLPLSHIAEHQLVMVQSMLYHGTVTFNESLPTLLRDMAETRPNYFFGAPRVWEQLQQGILAQFGSQQALDAALAADHEGTGQMIRTKLGLDDADYLLTAAAPTPPALIEWFGRLGLDLMEGFGQTECMATAVNTQQNRKVGSIGQVWQDVELKISAEGELIFKAGGSALGYYREPDKTAETFVDGWVHTGDKGYVDEDGFVFLTGRVKDYFKTIQGKFVAPPPIENQFAGNPWTEQLCLLGRGYSKTVMVCVLSEAGQQQPAEVVERDLLEHAAAVNQVVDKHARIGALMVSTRPWTIENEFLTPTLKIRRDVVEAEFGSRAQQLAHESAVTHEVKIEWAGAA